jgi:DNA-binding CsgD family transcriptional regulator
LEPKVLEMYRLKNSELKHLLEVIRDCNAISGYEPFESFPYKLVAELSRLIPSIHTTYTVIRPGTQELYNIGSTEVSSSPKVSRLLEQYLSEHPAFVQYMQTGDGQAIRISDCASKRQFHDTGLYRDFYRQYGIEDDLCIGFTPDASQHVIIVWHRDRRFTDRERFTANLLLPHVVQAWRNAQMLSGILGQQQLLNGCLESAAFAVIACDAEGRMQFVTAMAQKYLAEYFGVSRNLDRQLPPEILCWLKRQNAQFASGDGLPVRLPLSVRKESGLLTVRLLSSAGANLILLKETASAAPVDLCEGFGLSPRELDVLFWVAQGKTNAEISNILKMSLSTEKKHMEHILQKLMVETRTAAAALALRSLSRNE